LSLGRSTRCMIVTRGKTNLAIGCAASSPSTISSNLSHPNITSCSNCVRHVATKAENKLFKHVHPTRCTLCRFWKLNISLGCLLHTCFILGRSCNYKIFNWMVVTACVFVTFSPCSSYTSCSEWQSFTTSVSRLWNLVSISDWKMFTRFSQITTSICWSF